MSSLKNCYALLLLFLGSQALAKGVGNIASNISQPIIALAHLIDIICLVAGGGFLVASIFRYRQYRQNPVQTSFSSCVAMFLAGLAILSLILIPIPGAT